MLEWEASVGMKLPRLLLFICGTLAWAQYNYVPLLPDVPDNTVVATFDDGVKLTMAELRAYAATQQMEIQKQIAEDPAKFVQQFAVMRKLASIAKKKGLDQRSPAKDMLVYNDTLFVGQLAFQDGYTSAEVDPEDIAKAYDADKDKYKQVKVSAIYIAFGDPASTPAGDKKILTEAQAKAKAGKLLAEIRGGADFAKLARENSDDETSRRKDGYLDTLTPGDNIPEGFKVVFKLKEGETSEPIWQPNGYYLLHAGDVTYRPLKDVRDKVFNDLKARRFHEWLDQINTSTKVDFTNPALQPKPAKPAASAPGGTSK